MSRKVQRNQESRKLFVQNYNREKMEQAIKCINGQFQLIKMLIFNKRLLMKQFDFVLLQIKCMQDSQQKIQKQQFRTVVSGYRLHGQLCQNQQQVFDFHLSIQSSSNKDINYQLLFNNQNLQSFYLKDSFPSPKSLYEHLSKMTKTKIKFDSLNNTLIILHQKGKIVKQFPINLSHISKEQQNQPIQKLIKTKNVQVQHPTNPLQLKNQSLLKKNEESQIVQLKRQQQIQQTNKQNTQTVDQQISTQSLNQEENKLSLQTQEVQEIQEKQSQTEQQLKDQSQSQNINYPSQNINELSQDINQALTEDKVQQLRNILGYNQASNIDQNSIHQQKSIHYKFHRSQGQSLNLYEFSIKYQLQPLIDLIQNQQIDKTQQIILKRTKPIFEVPPFNQILLSNLLQLSLQQNKIENISNLNSMPNLEKLNLQANNIKVIQNLTNLKNLKILKLGNNKILQIRGLQTLPSLQTLWLDFNMIQKIQGLKFLTKLKCLNLSFNEISKIQGLDSLTSLQELLLNENQLTKIQNLGSLMKLTRLSLNSNFITEIKGLKKLLLLQVIYLTGNMIETFEKSAFDELNWLKMLKQLRLNGNQIQWSQQSTHRIERLKNYGVKVKI